jgi:type I restriction enzyme S subunit
MSTKPQSNHTPKLRFPGFEGEWEEKKLGELTDLITKGTTPNEFSNEGINFIKIESFNGNFIDLNKSLYISEKIHNKELKRSILQEGDILFAIAGATIGKVNVVTKDILPANTNQALSIVRLKKNQNREIIFQILKSKKMQKYILDNISVGAQPNLNLEQMNNFSFSLPSLPEQQKIADFLSAVDEKIEKLNQKKELVEKYKKGLMQEIFSQKLRFKDENGQDFGEWEEKKLGEIVDFIKNGLSLDQNTQKIGFKVTRIETISDKTININKVGYVDTDSDISEYKLEVGDILFSNINSVSHIGKIAFIDKDYNLYHGMNLLNIRVSKNTNSPYFYFQLLGSKKIKNYFERICNQAVNQASINQSDLKNTTLPVPSLLEQQKIADFLTCLDENIMQITNQLEKLREYKKGLLQGLMV